MFYVQAFKMIPHRRKKEPTKYGLATLRIEKHNNNLFTIIEQTTGRGSQTTKNVDAKKANKYIKRFSEKYTDCQTEYIGEHVLTTASYFTNNYNH